MALNIDMIEFERNPNLGLFGFVNNKYCLLGVEVSSAVKKTLENILKVPVYYVKIAGTSLAGVFVTGNDNGLVVPSIIFDEEKKELEKIEENILVLDIKETALSNSIIINNNGIVVSPEINEKARKKLAEFFSLELTETTVSGSDIIGSLAVANSTKGIISDEATEDEVETIKTALGISMIKTTLNFGTPYVNSAVLINDKGILIGKASTTIEINEVDMFYNFDD